MDESFTTRYLMISLTHQRHWLTNVLCARALNAGWEDGGMALDLDTFVERPLTEDEKRRITNLANDMDGER